MTIDVIRKRFNTDGNAEIERILTDFAERYNDLSYRPELQICQELGCSIEEIETIIEKIGLKDFLDFKSKMRRVALEIQSSNEKADACSLRGTLDLITRYEITNISELSRNINFELVDRLIQDIMGAPEVFLVTTNISQAYAIYASHVLSLVGVKVRVIDTSQRSILSITDLDKNGLVIYIGFARYTKSSILVLNKLRKEGFHIVSITDYPNTPVTMASDYSLFMPQHSYYYTTSMVTVNMLINLIVITISNKFPDILFQKLQEHDTAAQDLDIYI